MTFADTVTTIGVALILLGFLLLTLKKVTATDRLYNGLNLVGAAVACYGSYLIHSVPFIVLEGIWTVVSFYALIKKK